MSSQRSSSQPVISVCIPTYQGAGYLGHVLSILLYQAEELKGQVEIIIADDNSIDGTVELCSSLAGGRIRIIQNKLNIGMGPNIAACMSKYATGRYVWIWSQHCLLLPGALSRTLETIKLHPDVRVFYVNFRCAQYPEKWPTDVNGGYDGPFDYLSNADSKTKTVSKWHELLFPETCLCTQTYAHIVERETVKNYLDGRQVTRDFGPAIATFTQTTTTAECFFNELAVYIGEPVFTIFNGAQTWSQFETRSKVYFRALPELVGTFEAQGLSGNRLRQSQQYASMMASKIFSDHLNAFGLKNLSAILWYAVRFYHHEGCVQGLLKTLFASDWCAVVRVVRLMFRKFSLWKDYLIVRCRPARWYHNRRRRTNGGK